MARYPEKSRPPAGSAQRLNFAQVSSELLRALRGAKRSRPGFSRHLGYRSNVAQRWESGSSWPTATRFFAICARLRIDVDRAIAAFLRREPPWLGVTALHEPAGVAALLGELRGRTRLQEIALRTGFNRFSVSRWFKGTATPSLPEFLAVLEVCSARALDFVASFVDPSALPSLAAAWQALLLGRELAYAHPISHALLRALELEAYRSGRGKGSALLARQTGLSPEEVEQTLKLLVASGQVKRTRRGWVAQASPWVDTGADPTRSRALKLSWARVALARLEQGGPGYSGYSLFAVSRAELHKLREVQLAYVREMQGIISASRHSECIGLYCAQLIDLAQAEHNAFLQHKRP
jgi:DNA-binding phage protein